MRLNTTVGGGYNNTSSNLYSTVSGGHSNSVSGNSATIGGGEGNVSSTQFSTVGGGRFNIISAGTAATVAGGALNTAAADEASIGGGQSNTIQINADHATIGGGGLNTIVGSDLLPVYSTIGGGLGNIVQTNGAFAVIGGGSSNTILANAQYATIPGGYSNSAAGNYSFAAGNSAQALHDGTFVWSDATGAPFSSTGPNQFLVRASGGVGINTANPAGAALNVAGTVKASAFQGDGSGLFNLNSGAALGNYVFAYNTGAVFVAAANTFQDISFSTDAQINGWTHITGTAPYTSAQTGLYLIQYDATATTTLSTGASVSVHATLNLTEIPGSQASVILSTNSLQLSTISRSFIASVNASDVLTLQVAGSSTGSRLAGNGSGSPRPSVSMTITRIQ